MSWKTTPIRTEHYAIRMGVGHGSSDETMSVTCELYEDVTRREYLFRVFGTHLTVECIKSYREVVVHPNDISITAGIDSIFETLRMQYKETVIKRLTQDYTLVESLQLLCLNLSDEDQNLLGPLLDTMKERFDPRLPSTFTLPYRKSDHD